MKQTGNRAMLIAALMAGALGGAASARMWPAPASAFAKDFFQKITIVEIGWHMDLAGQK